MNKILHSLCQAVIATFVTAALFPTTVAGQDTENTKQQTTNVICGPYIQNVSEDGFTVVWISNVDAIGWVEVAPLDGQSFYYSDRPKFYDMSGCGVQPIGTTHKIRVSGLDPGTAYRYRVMMKGVSSYPSQQEIVYTKSYGANVYSAEPPVARTLAKDYSEVTFAVVNDVHGNDATFRKLFSDKDRNSSFDFVLLNGDMTSYLTNARDIMSYYLRSAGELFAAETPVFAVRGNHEYRGKECVKWLDYYDFPEGKPYYTFKYGKFFFIVLDSGEDKPDNDIEYNGTLCTDPYLAIEAEWLEEVVASEDFKNAERRIVFSHIPPDTGKRAWHGNFNMGKYFLPVLNEAGIDLMVCGHDHNFSFLKAGESEARFPVFVNDNLERLEINVSTKGISMKTYDAEGKNTHGVNL